MKTNKLFFTTLIVFFTTLLVSCDDFLNIQPKGILIPKTVTDYETLLNGYNIIEGSESYPAYITDDVFIPDIAKEGTPGLNNLTTSFKNLYTFKEKIFDEAEPDKLWNGAYARLYYYNIIVTQILAATDGTEQQKNSVRAEALMGRAFEYLFLVNAYAVHYDPKTASSDPAVPLILEPDINKTNLTRTPVQDVYNQIIADLTEAAKMLPERPAINSWRASKPGAWGLLSRTYLYLGNYPEALKYANMAMAKKNELIDLKRYRVVDSLQQFGRNNVPEQKYNIENIYMRQFSNSADMSGGAFCSEDLLAFFTEKDQRFRLYFSNKPQGKPNEYYLYMPYLMTNVGVSTPELYLIAAECEARTGSTEKAMQLINTIRDNRIFDNTPLAATSKEDALKKVLDERRRELALMGCFRLIDLKRLNKEPNLAKTITRTVENKTLTLPPNSPLYVLPIPIKVLRFNPDMKPNKR